MSDPAREPVIVLDRLTCRFGEVVAVDALSLEVRRGEVFGLLGHNGAGKTTTIRALNGIVEPASGTVSVFGRSPLADGPAVRRRTAVLPEASTVDERLTARETVELFARLYGVPAPEARARAARLLEEFGLAARADDRAGGFSKGMRQRLSLARALVHAPDLIFLDEPTAGLDPAATRQLHELIARWSRAEGRTVVLSTHNLAEAEALCDRVALVARGRLLAAGPVGELAAALAPAPAVVVAVAPGDAPRAASALREAGFDAHVRDAGPARAGEAEVEVAGAARDRVPDIAGRLVAAGVPFHGIAARRPTLADVYFALQPA